MLPIKTVLHPSDFSTGSDSAFRLACSIARDYGAHLVLLHVAEPPMAVYADGMIMATAEEFLKPQRKKLLRLMPRDRSVHVKHILTEGFAAPEILRIATENKADVIVMGTHGRTGLTRVVMGSVAEQVVRKATCPVLTVKTTPQKLETESIPSNAEQSLEAVTA